MSDHVPLRKQQETIESLTSKFADLMIEARPISSDDVASIEDTYKVRRGLLNKTKPGKSSGDAFIYAESMQEMLQEWKRQELPDELLEALFDVTEDDRLVGRKLRDKVVLDELMKSCDNAWQFLLNCSEPRREGVRFESEADQLRRLSEGFSHEFRGDSVQHLIDALKIYEMTYNAEEFYGRMIPFIQSSGTGKTRIGWELAAWIAAFYICLRTGHLPTDGWPPSDVSRDFFDELGEGYMAEEKAAAFLGAQMEILHQTAPLPGLPKKLLKPGPLGRDFKVESLKGDPRHQVLRRWMNKWKIEDPANVKQSSRHRQFNQVKQRTKELLLEKKEKLDQCRPPERVLKPAEKQERNMTSDSESDTNGSVTKQARQSVLLWHKKVFELLAKSSFDKLAVYLHNIGYNCFVICLDECTELNDPGLESLPSGPKTPQYKMSLIAMQRIIKSCDYIRFEHDFKFWYTLMDTNSSIYELAPTGRFANSFRLTGELKVLHVWCCTDFNQMVVHVQLQSAGHALFISFLVMFGRAYWRSLLDSPDVVVAAKRKLLCGDTFNPTNTSHVFAVFAIRIILELGGTDQSNRIAAEAVRSHMRVFLGVSNGVVYTAGPSEPILAVAAADILNQNPKHYQQAMNTLLRQLIIKGVVVDQGLKGELCTRLLLTLARDKATLPEGGSYVEHGKTYPRGGNANTGSVRAVTMWSFLATLLGDHALGMSTSSTRSTAEDLRRSTENVWVNFTHWVSIDEEITEVTVGWLEELWCSGVGIQCKFRQAVIDSLIVGYRGSLDQAFDRSLLTYLVIQTKAGVEAAELKLSLGLAGPRIRDGDKVYKPDNYVALLMDLCTKTMINETGSSKNIVYDHPTIPKAGKHARWEGYLRQSTDEGRDAHQRYCLNIRGHDDNVYPVIGEFKEEFDQMFERAMPCFDERFSEATSLMYKRINPFNTL